MTSEKRPPIPYSTQIAVWAAAAGRCTFCNCLVSENEDLGEIVSIGELAHNVGWSSRSPRGESELTSEERRQPENLLLLCRTCHKTIDAEAGEERYTVEVLRQYKQEFETRIRELTSIGGDRSATIVRMVSDIRGVSPELTRQTVLAATTAARCFPKLLPWAYWPSADLDLRGQAMATAEDFASAARHIDTFVARLHNGVKSDDIGRLAVFAFARIPLLVYLGAALDDKVDTLIFQRQRIDGANAWRWPENPPSPPTFAFRGLRAEAGGQHIALMINLSGTISPDALPIEIQQTHALYALEPVAPAHPGPTLISSEVALKNYEGALRDFLSHVEQAHHTAGTIAIFAAIPLAAAITLGRVLMPNVSPALAVYDRDEHGAFFRALEVRR